MNRPHALLRIALVLVWTLGSPFAAPATAQQPAPPSGGAGVSDRPATSEAIGPSDLSVRVGIFAHDSMQGREAGTPGHDRAVAYIVAELERLGLEPAGEDGGWLQTVPLLRWSLDPASGLRAGGRELALWRDYLPLRSRGATRLDGRVPAVFGGSIEDTTTWIPAEAAAGRFVVFAVGAGSRRFLPPVGPESRFHEAAAVAAVGPDVDAELLDVEWLQRAAVELPREEAGMAPARVLLDTRAAGHLFGAPLAALRPGAAGQDVEGRVAFRAQPAPSSNVVAILPGRDPALSGQFVALGAHSDHDGLRMAPLDHDSVRAVNRLARERQLARGGRIGPLPAAEMVEVRALAAGQARGPARADSVFNGADDDASGSMALLEIAEAYAPSARRPRRSLLFVWHTAEEKGLIGARWFTDHPTVPLDSIVAHINLDMIGRGSAEDLPGGGPAYLQLLGSRRLSTELGDIVEAVNASRERPFALDHSYDAPGHPDNYYCRSDHAMYARHGIPIVFFTTGSHVDYHQLTDEPQYIDYDHYSEVTRLVAELTSAVADLDHRLVVNGPKPDPSARCRQ